MQQAGFSLVWVTTGVMVVGILLTFSLTAHQRPGVQADAVTLERMQQIDVAIQGFMAANGRLPCPSDVTLDRADVDYAREAQHPGRCVTGSPSATFHDDPSSPTAVAGGVPVRDLSLANEAAVDAYGHRLIYVVDVQATDTTTCRELSEDAAPGTIQIRSSADNPIPRDSVLWAILSHGRDAHGAFPQDNGSMVSRIQTGNTNPDTLLNAFVDSDFGTEFSGTLVRREADLSKVNSFDDLVWYPPAFRNTCCLGPMCRGG